MAYTLQQRQGGFGMKVAKLTGAQRFELHIRVTVQDEQEFVAANEEVEHFDDAAGREDAIRRAVTQAAIEAAIDAGLLRREPK
jgi:uncharacterized iron-regulated protein